MMYYNRNTELYNELVISTQNNKLTYIAKEILAQQVDYLYGLNKSSIHRFLTTDYIKQYIFRIVWKKFDIKNDTFALSYFHNVNLNLYKNRFNL